MVNADLAAEPPKYTPKHIGAVLALAFSSDGKMFAVVGW
jgi:hypothetical protein